MTVLTSSFAKYLCPTESHKLCFPIRHLEALRSSLSGQNLWFEAFGFPKGLNYDPEVLSLGVGNGRGFERSNVPTNKLLGGTVRVTF